MKLTVFFLSLVAYLPLWAESVDEQSKRVCQVIRLNKPVDSLYRGFLFDGTKSQEVMLSTKGFSDIVELAEGELTLYFSPSPVNERDDLPEGTHSVQLSEEITDFYLLIKPTADAEESRYSLEVVDVSGEKLKMGETLWINLTKHNISANFGEESFMIPPEGRVVSPPPLKESGYYPVHFRYQRGGEGDYRSVFKRTWRHMKAAKSLGFVIDTGGRRPQIFTVRDRR